MPPGVAPLGQTIVVMSDSNALRPRPSSRPYSLDEVHAAVRALRAGAFAHQSGRPAKRGPFSRADSPGPQPAILESSRSNDTQPHSVNHCWVPALGERVVAVVGSSGSCGASTLALGLAMTSPVSARVIECCSASASGLAAASTTELGLQASGWQHGRRERVLIERASQVLAGVDDVPIPTNFLVPSHPDSTGLTVLDVGWEVGQLVASNSWLLEGIGRADQVLVVAPATVPGIRRLEGALELLDRASGRRCGGTRVAVLGPKRQKWPRGLQHAGGPHTRRALDDKGSVIEIPEDRELAMNGLDSRPLPQQLLTAASRMHESMLVDPPRSGTGGVLELVDDAVDPAR